MISLSYLVELLFSITYLILIIYILVSWIPIFDQRKEPMVTINKISNAIFAPFRAIIPPIGGVLDISPIFAFLLLRVLEHFLLSLLIQLGL